LHDIAGGVCPILGTDFSAQPDEKMGSASNKAINGIIEAGINA
jgi:hypothetical protein